MTLAAYQAAFARIVLSPALCRRAREQGDAAFEGFEMDAVERARLLDIARQPGMRITCMLARANRLSSLVGALPLSCELLKPELSGLLDRYWDAEPMANLQALPAGLAFAHFLRAEIEAGRIVRPHAADVLRCELARLELQLAAHTGTGRAMRALRFDFDPAPLLDALAAGTRPPATLPARPTVLEIDFRTDPPQTRVRPVDTASR